MSATSASSIGQNALNNFYQSVKFYNPSLGVLMADDVITVALNAMGGDKRRGQEAAQELRKKALVYDLPDSLLRVLENAITQLGYS